MIGYNFNLDIYFHELPGNINEKMSQKVYIEQIFQSIIKLWIEAYHDFILEEDSDSSHETRKSNIICT